MAPKGSEWKGRKHTVIYELVLCLQNVIDTLNNEIGIALCTALDKRNTM